MNLDELKSSIRKVSKEDIIQKLANHISNWKTDKQNT